MSDSASVIDVSSLALRFRHRPVTSASRELVRAHGGVEELEDTIAEVFGPEGQWREVGNDLHTVSMGDAEIRLRLQPDAVSWHADLFHAGWDSPPYENVPAEFRVQVATYVDRVTELQDGLLQECDLRAAAAKGGFPAVDHLVGRHLASLDERHAALDGLHGALLTPAGVLPDWAMELVLQEAEYLNTGREWLTSAVMAYHHGSAGRRPDTLFGGLCFVFSTGSVDLLRR